MAFHAALLSSGRIVPRVTIGIVMVIGKEKCYDFHPTSISGHNIIRFIAVWYITEDIVAFVLAKITSCTQRVKYFLQLFESGLDRFSGYQSRTNRELQKTFFLANIEQLAQLSLPYL